VARDEAEVTSDVDVLPDHSQGNAYAAGVSPSPGSLKRENCDKARPDPPAIVHNSRVALCLWRRTSSLDRIRGS
jgi:hypothetical protein